MRLKIIACFLSLPLLASCATKSILVAESHENLTIIADGIRGNIFLQKKNTKGVAEGIKHGRSILFPSKNFNAAETCIFLQDEKGNVLNDGNGFLVTLPGKWTIATNALRVTEQELETLHRQIQSAISESNANETSLFKNRSHSNGICIRPAMRELPIKPESKCASRDECFRDATQICAVSVIGAEACGKFLSEMQISGLVSGPGCGLFTARLINQKYDIGDAFELSVVGGADGLADAMLEKDNDLSQGLGAFLKSLTTKYKLESFVSCRNSFYKKHYSVIRDWDLESSMIRDEPEILYARCNAAITVRESMQEKVEQLSAAKQVTEAEAVRIRDFLEILKNQAPRPPASCR